MDEFFLKYEKSASIHSTQFQNPILFGSRVKYDNEPVKYYEHVQIEGKTFKLEMFFVVDLKDKVSFGQIKSIILVNDKIYLTMKVFEEYSFNSHRHAYVVEYSHDITTLCKFLPNISSVISVEEDNIHYIVAPYGL